MYIFSSEHIFKLFSDFSLIRSCEAAACQAYYCLAYSGQPDWVLWYTWILIRIKFAICENICKLCNITTAPSSHGGQLSDLLGSNNPPLSCWFTSVVSKLDMLLANCKMQFSLIYSISQRYGLITQLHHVSFKQKCLPCEFGHVTVGGPTLRNSKGYYKLRTAHWEMSRFPERFKLLYTHGLRRYPQTNSMSHVLLEKARCLNFVMEMRKMHTEQSENHG